MQKKVYIVLLAVSFLLAFIIDTSQYSTLSSILLLLIGFAVLISFLFYKEPNSYVRRIYLRPIHLFLLSFAIVFYQTPIDILMGYQTDYYYVGSIGLMPECVRLADMGIIAFIIGYISVSNSKKQIKSSNNFRMAPVFIYKALTSLFLVVIIIVMPKSVLMGGYHSVGLDDSIFSYLDSWCSVFFCAFFIQNTINMKLRHEGNGMTLFEYIRSLGWWQNVNMASYSLLILNIGDRGPIIVVALLYYLSYISVSGMCPSKKFLATSIIAGGIFVAFLGYTKQYRDNNSIFERIMVTLNENPYDKLDKSVFQPTHELAISYRCLPYSVDDMQKNGNYGYGKYQLSYILSCIPFASGLLDLPKPTSNYISHLIQGTWLTYGNGTNIIADFYLDGGLIAVILLMFIFGFFVRYFEYAMFAKTDSTLLLFCMAFYFSIHFISIPRSFVLLNLKYSVWLTIILYLFQKNSKQTRNCQ
jgi:hypothetical protein